MVAICGAINDRGFILSTHHCQVVISASHRLPKRKHNELLDEVRRELESIWRAAPKTRRAGTPVAVGVAVKLPPQQDAPPPRLLHGRVITQPAAVFSVVPGLNRIRPTQQTAIQNLALAGDWTSTGWPATMEGAVRSGYSAVERLAASLGLANL